MAKMYPPFVSPDTKSPGERDLFGKIRDDPATQDWLVLHSLNIADHVKRVSGEADFVIIVPNQGILCLEVKASQSIRRDNGLWYYGTKSGSDSRGPFKQASEAMHSIRKRLIDKDPTLSNLVFWSAVLFPYLEFDIYSPEWHSWQAIDNKQFHLVPISKIVLNVLAQARSLLKVHAGLILQNPSPIYNNLSVPFLSLDLTLRFSNHQQRN
jgi:hypothetical protein